MFLYLLTLFVLYRWPYARPRELSNINRKRESTSMYANIQSSPFIMMDVSPSAKKQVTANMKFNPSSQAQEFRHDETNSQGTVSPPSCFHTFSPSEFCITSKTISSQASPKALANPSSPFNSFTRDAKTITCKRTTVVAEPTLPVQQQVPYQQPATLLQHSNCNNQFEQYAVAAETCQQLPSFSEFLRSVSSMQ